MIVILLINMTTFTFYELKVNLRKVLGGVGVLKMVNIQKVAELGKILKIILL